MIVRLRMLAPVIPLVFPCSSDGEDRLGCTLCPAMICRLMPLLNRSLISKQYEPDGELIISPETGYYLQSRLTGSLASYRVRGIMDVSR